MDEVPTDTTDKVRWIDTDCMLADPLTKVMEPWKLDEALESNYWSVKQPIESILKKRAKQLQRRKTKDADKAPEEEEEELIPDEQYNAAMYARNSTDISSSELYRVQTDERYSCFVRYDYDASTYRTLMRGGPDWKDIQFRVTIDLQTGKLLAKERVSHDVQYDWHQPLPKGKKYCIRTELYYEHDSNTDSGSDRCRDGYIFVE